MTRTEEAGILLSLLDVMVGEQEKPVIVKRRSTTSLRKYIIDQLFNDAYIVAFGADCYRLRSKQHHPLRKFYNETFKAIKPILRHRGGAFPAKQKCSSQPSRQSLCEDKISFTQKNSCMNKCIQPSVVGVHISKKMHPVPAPLTTLLVASPGCLRSLACSLRQRKQPYRIERIEFKNFNPSWKGHKGIGLRVTLDAYESLFQTIPSA